MIEIGNVLDSSRIDQRLYFLEDKVHSISHPSKNKNISKNINKNKNVNYSFKPSALSSLNLWVGLARKLPRLSDRKSPHIDQY